MAKASVEHLEPDSFEADDATDDVMEEEKDDEVNDPPLASPGNECSSANKLWTPKLMLNKSDL